MTESVGARLRQARELRRLTLQQVSETTKVRPHYLQALESDDHSAIPSAAQARGFLRIYAAFLELDLADLLPPPPPPEPTPSVAPVEAPATPGPHPNLWDGLRERLSPRKKQDTPASPEDSQPPAAPVVAPDEPASVPEALPAAAVAADQPAIPAAPDVQPATVEVKTKSSRRPRTSPRKSTSDGEAPDDLKKNDPS